MEGFTPAEERLRKAADAETTAAAQRKRAAYTNRLRSYADMLDKHPEVELPGDELPMPVTGPFVTASYIGQLEAFIEFLDRTAVPVHRYGSATTYWHADSVEEVDRIAALAGITPEWNKNGQRYGAVRSFGPNFEYEVSCHKERAEKSAAAALAEGTSEAAPAGEVMTAGVPA